MRQRLDWSRILSVWTVYFYLRPYTFIRDRILSFETVNFHLRPYTFRYDRIDIVIFQNSIADRIKSTLQNDSDMRDHYFDSKFEVTSIVPENVEQVENFLIDEMNNGFQFFYQVETLEAPMVICGDAEIRLQEIFEEEIQEDQYWTDMAKDHGIVPLVNMTSMPEDDAIFTSFYYINNRKFIGVSH